MRVAFRTDMQVTKLQVCEALMTEPLVAGSWVQCASDHEEYKNCGVCAVGAVLRKCGLSNSHITRRAVRVTDGEDSVSKCVEDALQANHLILALSRFFEQMIRRRCSTSCIDYIDDRRSGFSFDMTDDERAVTYQERLKLVEFVDKNFPETIDIGE